MSINLALVDAANNCVRHSARAILTLRSGVRIEGRLEKSSGADLGTTHMKLDDGGWMTVLIEEIAVVEAHPR